MPALWTLQDSQVTFRWKDYAHAGQWRLMTLDAIEFVRRFLMHVLPSGFVRIRRYGLLANCHRRAKLARCRELLGSTSTIDPNLSDRASLPERESPVTPTRVCPNCGAGRMRLIGALPPLTMAPSSLAATAPSLTFDTS
jgi:hypothetical protein